MFLLFVAYLRYGYSVRVMIHEKDRWMIESIPLRQGHEIVNFDVTNPKTGKTGIWLDSKPIDNVSLHKGTFLTIDTGFFFS